MWQTRLFSQNDMFSFNAMFFRAKLNFKFVTIDLSKDVEFVEFIDIFDVERLISFVKFVIIVNICVNFDRNNFNIREFSCIYSKDVNIIIVKKSYFKNILQY